MKLELKTGSLFRVTQKIPRVIPNFYLYYHTST